ncbi:hypothetical protein GCM10022197_29820 [Microlunatus spumicola]|uniref:Uncharacterized protein n=1 Tax=Microlunatus spumicola TaxID=81499 RepID=A0ABP6XSK2_9ACTN
MRESAWSRRIESVSLVTEDLPESQFTEQALTAFGRVLRRAEFTQHPQLLRRWPAVQVVSTVRAAVDHYQQGTFWPKLGGLIGITMNQGLQFDWGNAFLRNLRALGLPTFDLVDDPGAKYVGRVLMHAGMPTYCLNDYFDLIAERRRRIARLEPDAFVSWAGGQAAAGRLTSVDTPVRRFMRYGGEYAVDVTDRTFELIDVVSAGGDGSEVPLPDRFRLAAQRWALQERAQETSRGGAEASATLQPQLALDPYGQGVVLRLPPVPDSDGRATWVIRLGNRSERVAARATWPGKQEAPSLDVPVLAPERAASVSLLGYEQHQATITVVDDQAPILAFGEDGRFIPAGLPLPGMPVWLLFPGDQTALEITGHGHVAAEGNLSTGWMGWSLVLADLTGSTAIFASGSSRTVRLSSAVRILAGEPLKGLRSTSGFPVFPLRPRVELPAPSGSNASWTVDILDASLKQVASRQVTTSEEAETIWSTLPTHLVGSYTVRVRGPWGRGATRQLELLEGVTLRVTPAWRRMARGGLVPASATLALSPRVWASKERIEFGAQDLVDDVEIRTADGSGTYLLEPGHMSISYQDTTSPPTPTVNPVRLFTEDILDDPGTLMVHVGEAAEPVVFVRSNGRVLQQLIPGAARRGIYPFRLSQVTDTIRTNPYVSLSLDAEGVVAVAALQPRRLFSEVRVEGRSLLFEDCHETPGLTAAVYACRAPWRGAATLLIADGCAELPEHLLDAGPLLVSVVIDDPWVPAAIPSWPQVGSAILLPDEGSLRVEDEEEAVISAWLAGLSDLPTQVRDLSKLWIVLARRRNLALGERKPSVLEDCVARLQRQPAPALAAVPLSALEPADLPALLIRSGLLVHPGGVSDVVDPGADFTRPSSLIATARWVSALLRRAGDPTVLDALNDDAVTVCGTAFDELREGNDPTPRAGRFDENAAVYARLDDQARAYLRAGLRLVPKGLLDADSRVQASLQLLESRKHPLLKAVVTESHRRSAQIEALLSSLGDADGLAAFCARKHPTNQGGWRALSSLSLGFALVGRHAAHGRHQVNTWLGLHEGEWADLGSVAPDLVTIDLVLAELIVSRQAVRTAKDLQ